MGPMVILVLESSLVVVVVWLCVVVGVVYLLELRRNYELRERRIEDIE